jgi:hypothetical protein
MTQSDLSSCGGNAADLGLQYLGSELRIVRELEFRDASIFYLGISDIRYKNHDYAAQMNNELATMIIEAILAPALYAVQIPSMTPFPSINAQASPLSPLLNAVNSPPDL